jgi:hypothetical protein
MEDLANMNAGLLEDATLPSEFSSEIPVRYARSSATQRLLMKQKLSDRIKSSTRGIYEDHVRPYGQTAAKGISSTINMRGLATSLGIGLGAGVAVGEVGHALGIDKDQNPIIYAGEVGATAGAISEAASIKLATGAITGAADAGRIASSAVSGGVGLVVGSAATYGLNKLMKGANPYVKNITSQVVGGEVGLASGNRTSNCGKFSSNRRISSFYYGSGSNRRCGSSRGLLESQWLGDCCWCGSNCGRRRCSRLDRRKF